MGLLLRCPPTAASLAGLGVACVVMSLVRVYFRRHCSPLHRSYICVRIPNRKNVRQEVYRAGAGVITWCHLMHPAVTLGALVALIRSSRAYARDVLLSLSVHYPFPEPAQRRLPHVRTERGYHSTAPTYASCALMHPWLLSWCLPTCTLWCVWGAQGKIVRAGRWSRHIGVEVV